MQIILIPGLMNDAWVWHGQIGALSRLGSVHIARTDGHDSLSAMAAQIASETQGPMIAIGHSMGGRVALELAAMVPDRLAGLILLDSGAHGPKADEATHRLPLVELARAKGFGAVTDQWLPPMLGDRARQDQSLCAQIRQMLERCTVDTFAGQQQALLTRPDRTSLLTSLACPFLAVTGSEDRWASPDQHRAMAEAAPDGRFVEVAGAGHMLPVEAPEETAQILWEFIAGRISSHR